MAIWLSPAFQASLRHIVQVPNSEPDSKIKLSIDDEMPVDEPLLNADPEKKEPDAIWKAWISVLTLLWDKDKSLNRCICVTPE